MRLFVSVDVPPVEIEGFRLGAPEAPAHLTVLFLGEVPDAQAGPIQERCTSAVRGRSPFDLELRGIGVFPGPERPRVVWVGVGDGATELSTLHADLAGACRALQVPVEARPFVPHLTLRRIHGPRDAEVARRWLGEFGGTRFGRGRVTELALKQSLLGSGPVVHRVLSRFPLEGPAPSG